MEKISFDYSMKNIPIPPQSSYMKNLIEKVEKFVKRIRWKAYFFEHPSEKTANENFGFMSNKTPPQNESINPFEDDIYELVKDIEFKSVKNKFQQKLNGDLKNNRNSKNLFVFADKTSNLYEITKENYNKLLHGHITKTYKETDSSMKDKIAKEAANISKSFHIQDRAERYPERKAFITLKDRQGNFRSNSKCRLLNPSKSEIGYISKSFLERIISDVKRSTKVNQWTETSTVIEWFKKIENKKSSRFIKFDIVDFYPSISEQLLDNALTFAKLHTTISDQKIRILKHPPKELLFDSKDIWIKNSENPMFYVTMGSLDGTEVCEIVRLYLLDKVSVLLSRDNGGLLEMTD